MLKATGSKSGLRVAVASGKGGTGKTTISVALALSAPGSVALLDCDVEEPNAALFLSHEAEGATLSERNVTVPIPVVDTSRCTACGACARACRFNAIAIIKRQVAIFEDLCHACGACALACPVQAIHEEPKLIGKLKEWNNGKLGFIQGEMEIGSSMAPPLIRAVKRRALEGNAELIIIDCPPGTSCPMVSAVRDSDFVILVTEPTPFGLNDLKLAVETVRQLALPFGVLINRDGIGDDAVQKYCDAEGISVLAKFPHDRRIAEAYSSGRAVLAADTLYADLIAALHDRVRAIIEK